MCWLVSKNSSTPAVPQNSQSGYDAAIPQAERLKPDSKSGFGKLNLLSMCSSKPGEVAR
jgi:hypothetical protein